MQEITAKAIIDNPRLNKYLIAAITLVIILLIGFLVYYIQEKPDTSLSSPQIATISLTTLEEQYGIQVYLVAVTAMGGLVDMRLKFVDGEKAKSLLQNPNSFPALRIANSDQSLTASAGAQEIKFEDNGNLFLMYPNTGNVVKPGTPVTIVFGDRQVEPILAK